MKYILLFFAVILYSSCTEKKSEPVIQYENLMADDSDDVLRDQALKSQGTGVHKVEIKGMNFEPKDVVVKAGDTVLWLNKDLFVHDVTELRNKKWSSSKLQPGASWAKIIKENDEYFCSIHVVMKGTIVVKK